MNFGVIRLHFNMLPTMMLILIKTKFNVASLNMNIARWLALVLLLVTEMVD